MKNKTEEEYLSGYELAERTGEIPQEADFALTLRDDCMEPYFKKNRTVYVQARAELCEFEAGIFYYKGRVLCRQWCQDHRGGIHLLCANPKREEENIVTDSENLVVLGKVLCKKKLCAPSYR